MTENDFISSALQTRYGRLSLPDDQNDLIGRFLRTYGEWAPYEVQFVASQIPPGGRVADIGAFIGTFGLGLMQYQALSTVCFVEGNPRTAPHLRENVAHNAKSPCTVIEAIVLPSAMRGVVVGSMEAGNAGSFSVSPTATTDRVAANASDQQLTLGEILQRHGPFDLIKLDVEGLENALLQDEITFVREGSTSFWLECNESDTSLAMCQTLLDAGLKVHYGAFPVTAADNYNRSDVTILPWAYESGLWAARGPAPVMSAALKEAGCIMREVRSTDELRAVMWQTPRWSPPGWAGHDAPFVVAAACHTILGQLFDDYLVDANATTRSASWVKPMTVVFEERLYDMAKRLARSQAELRATEVMIHAERAWSAEQAKQFTADTAALHVAANLTAANLSARIEAFETSTAIGIAQIEVFENSAAIRTARIEAFENSTAIRMARRLGRLSHEFPLTARVIRPVVRAARRLLRRV